MFNRLKKHTPALKQVEVDYRICHYCGACVGACPANAIFLENAHLRIDHSCTHCERCVPACPIGALFFMDLPIEVAG